MAHLQKSILVCAAAALAFFLQGCSVGTESESCDGDMCSCSLSFRSFWARISISGVHIEHASRYFNIPNVAKDVANATSAPCCNAIYDQIDYDEGKTSSMPNKTLATFSSSCASSPNSEISKAAAASGNKSVMAVSRRLRDVASTFVHTDKPEERRLASSNYEPIQTGQDGQDCEITSSGFSLNNMKISTGSMKILVRWVDPEEHGSQTGAPCCDALKPILEKVYFAGQNESQLSADVRDKFCTSCKNSPNVGIALAAYRCFGSSHETQIDV